MTFRGVVVAAALAAAGCGGGGSSHPRLATLQQSAANVVHEASQHHAAATVRAFNAFTGQFHSDRPRIHSKAPQLEVLIVNRLADMAAAIGRGDAAAEARESRALKAAVDSAARAVD